MSLRAFENLTNFASRFSCAAKSPLLKIVVCLLTSPLLFKTRHIAPIPEHKDKNTRKLQNENFRRSRFFRRCDGSPVSSRDIKQPVLLGRRFPGTFCCSSSGEKNK